VLTTLREKPAEWRYGYDISTETGLASGTLYPILARLAERGLLETHWEDEPPEGRPRRHLYRLTADGAALAESVPATPAARAVRRRPAVEGA
jgi:DNA-binding PadR family transcriptional regulator